MLYVKEQMLSVRNFSNKWIVLKIFTSLFHVQCSEAVCSTLSCTMKVGSLNTVPSNHLLLTSDAA